MNSKTLIGGITASILFFFLGWLVYGVLLIDFSTAHYNHCMDKGMDGFVWWAMIVSNISWGFFLAIILNWSDSWDFAGGAKIGAIVGLLTSLAINLQFYAMTTMYSSIKVVGFDLVVSMVFSAVVGALTALVASKIAKS